MAAVVAVLTMKTKIEPAVLVLLCGAIGYFLFA
jgi:chromate transport protein ChrA